MRYKFSPQAEQGLDEIIDYISLDSKVSAKAVALSITGKLELLTSMPKMGRVIDKINGHNIYLTSAKKYLQYQIFYQLLEDEQVIDVLLVWDSRRNIPTLYNKWRELFKDI